MARRVAGQRRPDRGPAAAAQEPHLVVVGRIGRPQGIKGEDDPPPMRVAEPKPDKKALYEAAVRSGMDEPTTEATTAKKKAAPKKAAAAEAPAEETPAAEAAAPEAAAEEAPAAEAPAEETPAPAETPAE